jgi:hypothetical protein
MNTFEVNFLITTSRFTGKFFSLITGEESIFQNPGIALRSIVISRFIQNEFIEVPAATGEEITRLIDECVKFESENLNSVAGKFTTEIENLKQSLMTLRPKQQKSIHPDLIRLDFLISKLNEASEERVYKQALYDVYDQILLINGYIEEMVPPPKEYA